MPRHKGQRMLTIRLTNEVEQYPYRIVIEGRHFGPSPADVKQTICEAIEEAAKKVPGAEMLYVTTRHRDVVRRASGAVPRAGGVRQVPGVKPGAHPKTTRNPFRRGSKEARQWIRERATVGAAKRLGWSQERLDQALAELREGMPPLRERSYTEVKAARGPTAGKPLSQTPGAIRMREKRQEGWVDPSPSKQKRKRRVPYGLHVVEELSNGSRILSDGSRLTAKGRHLSAETVAKLQRTAGNARDIRFSNNHPHQEVESFPEPPALSEAPRQEVHHRPEPPAREDQPIRVQKPNVLRRIMGWQSPEPRPVIDLPEQTQEDWWDNVIRAYLRPDCDADALIRNNHITVGQLDQELERRGIRRYSARTLPEGLPGRLH